MGRRYDTISFLSDYGLDRRVRRRREVGDPLASHRTSSSSTSPTRSRRTTCAAVASPSPVAPSTSRPASCSPSSIPASAATDAPSPSRSATGNRVLSGRTTACSPRGRDGRRRRPGGRADQPRRTSCPRPGRPSPAATCSRRPPRISATASTSRELGELIDPRPCSRAVARDTRRGRCRGRRGAVGRPVRQRAAERRSRRGRASSATESVCGSRRRSAPRSERTVTRRCGPARSGSSSTRTACSRLPSTAAPPRSSSASTRAIPSRLESFDGSRAVAAHRQRRGRTDREEGHHDRTRPCCWS